MKKLRLALLGRDVSLSDSEKIHRFILGKMGTECDYEKVSVPETAFWRAAERLLNETDGFNVTIPYKRSIFPYLKSIKGDAAAYGSVNTVVSAEKAGYNTDGKGFLLMLEGAGITVRRGRRGQEHGRGAQSCGRPCVPVSEESPAPERSVRRTRRRGGGERRPLRHFHQLHGRGHARKYGAIPRCGRGAESVSDGGGSHLSARGIGIFAARAGTGQKDAFGRRHAVLSGVLFRLSVSRQKRKCRGGEGVIRGISAKNAINAKRYEHTVTI